MATVAGASLLEWAAAATVVSAGVEAYSSIQQGQQQANIAKAKARQAKLNASQQQIQMRKNMLRALASQNAGTLGAIGTGGATSFAANARRQITQNQNDLLISNANKSAQVSLLDQAASSDMAAGELGAAGAVAQGVKNYYGLMSGAQGGG